MTTPYIGIRLNCSSLRKIKKATSTFSTIQQSADICSQRSKASAPAKTGAISRLTKTRKVNHFRFFASWDRIKKKILRPKNRFSDPESDNFIT